MTTQGRVAVSIAASLFLIFGLLVAFALLGGAPDPRQCATRAKGEDSEPSLSLAQGKEKRNPASEDPIERTSGGGGVAVEEQPIEEVLAEEGEDPGAVYYMSRVRLILREGNPAFARELLRQMKEEYPNSVLVEEADRLFDDGGRKP
jgi:hypothetical protein